MPPRTLSLHLPTGMLPPPCSSNSNSSSSSSDLSATPAQHFFSLHVTSYDSPFSEPPRLRVSLHAAPNTCQPPLPCDHTGLHACGPSCGGNLSMHAAPDPGPPAPSLCSAASPTEPAHSSQHGHVLPPHAHFTVELSINAPLMSTPPHKHFYFVPALATAASKLAHGHPEGTATSATVLQQLVDQGVLRLVDPVGVPVPGCRTKAPAVELLWPWEEMDVHIAGSEERRRVAEDLERFLSNTYVMHLGM